MKLFNCHRCQGAAEAQLTRSRRHGKQNSRVCAPFVVSKGESFRAVVVFHLGSEHMTCFFSQESLIDIVLLGFMKN
jgi:hypothetical protein